MTYRRELNKEQKKNSVEKFLKIAGCVCMLCGVICFACGNVASALSCMSLGVLDMCMTLSYYEQ